TYKGKYGEAKVMIDSVDSATISQVYEFLNHEAFTNPIAVMPDCHKGNGAVIGFTMKMTDMIIPNVVGVDINCGMFSMNVGKNVLAEMSREDIDGNIRDYIPFSTSVHSKDLVINEGFFDSVTAEHRKFVMKFNKQKGAHYSPIEFNMKFLEQTCEKVGMDFSRAIKSIGTLGGGNHFIELGKSQLTGDYWFTIHSGSRQFGLKICNYWQRQAGKGQLAYLTGADMFGYLTDMVFAQKYADLNRLHMASYVLEACRHGWSDVKQHIQTSHNFIDFDDFIIRKGAIRSYSEEYMIIPFNMEDGILLCSGRSNPEWNFSAPHGAGRVGSRRWAKENLKIEDAKQRMEQNDIYCSKLPNDELKGAYKDPKIIEEAIEPTAIIVDRFKPVLVMKG
ncbi:MAG TPA: RtcB family protein, partial [Candidatus Glassbacteria bacterium]|nr:RtcB family protein [Candidatus Glassbacteria bacterium]